VESGDRPKFHAAHVDRASAVDPPIVAAVGADAEARTAVNPLETPGDGLPVARKGEPARESPF
jgi:hypothetical protein